MNLSDLFKNIALVAPAFSAVINEHLNDYDNLLPHLLMSDLLRYVGEKILSNEPRDLAEIKEILGILETAFTSGNTDTENAIAVSFIENMGTEKFFILLNPLLGPAMRTEYQRQVE